MYILRTYQDIFDFNVDQQGYMDDIDDSDDESEHSDDETQSWTIVSPRKPRTSLNVNTMNNNRAVPAVPLQNHFALLVVEEGTRIPMPAMGAHTSQVRCRCLMR